MASCFSLEYYYQHCHSFHTRHNPVMHAQIQTILYWSLFPQWLQKFAFSRFGFWHFWHVTVPFAVFLFSPPFSIFFSCFSVCVACLLTLFVILASPCGSLICRNVIKGRPSTIKITSPMVIEDVLVLPVPCTLLIEPNLWL